jgi:hypothetical protein
MLMSLTGTEQFPTLRLLCPAGEPVYKRDVDLYKRHFAPHCVFQNALGTTETRTVTQYFIDQHTPVDDGLVPVGYTVAEQEVLLLNDAGEVAPSGWRDCRAQWLPFSGYWFRRPAQAAFGQIRGIVVNACIAPATWGGSIPMAAWCLGPKDFRWSWPPHWWPRSSWPCRYPPSEAVVVAHHDQVATNI